MRLAQPPRLQLHGAKWSSLEGAARGRAEGDAPLAAFSSYSTHDKYRNAAEPVWAETVWSCRLVLSFGLVVPALAGDRVGMDERSPCAVKHRDREGFLTSLGLHRHLQFSLSLVI